MFSRSLLIAVLAASSLIATTSVAQSRDALSSGDSPATESSSPNTGPPGRTGSEATAKGKDSRDPTKSRSARPSRSHTVVGPESPNGRAEQGPGDSIGKTVPERPTHQDRKIP